MTQANILAQIGSQSGPTFRNRIINGAMQVTQYGGGATNNGSGATATYSVDRWALYGSSSSKFTGQQSSGTSLAGFNKWLYLVSSAATSLGASDYYTVYQSIEGLNVADLGWGTANAKTITLSFWVIGSVAGTYGGSLSNGANNRSYPFTYPVTTSWSQVSVTIAGDTTGTWNTDNTRGITLTYGLGVGTTYSGTAGSWAGTLYLSATGATNFVGTSGANLSITGVQLEVGSSATGFEYRQYQQELALCQRYYWKWVPSSASSYLATTMNFNTVTCYAPVKLPTTMRATPTLTTSGTASDYGGYSSSTRFTLSSVPAIDTSNYDTPNVSFSVASGLTAGYAGIFGSNTTNGYLGFNAEL